MGTATAGFSGSIAVSTDDVTYNDVGGANSVENSRTRESLDSTDFSDSAFTRVMGLKDVSFSISGNYDDADAGQTAIESALDNGTDIYVRFLVDGTNGYKAKCVCTSHDLSGSPDGKGEFTAEFEGNDGTNGWTAV